jgi:predicted GNAT family acetyltransferase
MYEIRVYPSARSFLVEAEAWLLSREDRHNLMLSLAYARASAEDTRTSADGADAEDPFYATVEQGGRLVGCVMRTPPHKVLITDLPVAAAPVVVAALGEAFDRIPAVLGPADAAQAVAAEWAARHGGGWHLGMEQRMYRLDEVTSVTGVEGRIRVAVPADFALAVRWGEAFTLDAGLRFETDREMVARWIEREVLHVWEVDDSPVSMAVAQGRTPHGIRIGYVYTPPEHRRHGYAGALVAALSRKLLEDGVRFCVLYTDVSNATSNAIYQRVGYEPIEDVRDVDLVTEEET